MAGKVIVVTGPMRSGKTLHIVLKALEAKQLGKTVLAYHPNMSSRWDKDHIVSRIKVGDSNLSYPSIPVDTALSHFLMGLPPADVVILDDAQFFTEAIVSTVRVLRNKGIDVIISGLDMDAFQQPFGPMPMLMAIADKVIKKLAVCDDCHSPAQCTYRLVGESSQILVGDDEYVSLCWDCWKARKDEEKLEL